MQRKYTCLLILIYSLPLIASAQPLVTDSVNRTGTVESSAYFGINHIYITGNSKTKPSVILREIPFRPGEAYPSQTFYQRLEDGRKQLMNTSLFHSVSITPRESFESGCYDIIIEVKERWYIFPVPYFKPADRNLNQWLFENHADLRRINYGAKLVYNNVTGRNDKLRATIINGYTQQLGLTYNQAYFDRKMHWGMSTGLLYGRAREMNYNTVGDKQVFLKEPEFVRSFLNANLAVSYRRAIRTRHNFGINFTWEKVADTIVALNPSYFKTGRKSIGYPTFYYTLDYFNLDYIPYPTDGFALRVSLSKSGVDPSINLWQLHAKGSAYWPLGSKSFINLNLYGGIKLPFHQPYFLQRFLGYGDVFLQGYEYYVIDGTAGGYTKLTLARELFKGNINYGRKKKKMLPDSIPFRIYGKIYGNAGYVYNPQPGNSDLSNRFLFSGGIGLDIITIYDLCVRLEWSFNQLGQNGLFLHPKTLF
jgi:outer membrane protein assembly factor BamA